MKFPIKITFKSEALSVFLVFITIISSFYFFKKFPDSVPVHWNINGDVDSYGTPLFAAFVFPLIILSLYLLFLIIPAIDPKKNRYKQFSRVYNIFKNAIIFLLTSIYFLTSFFAIGYDIDITKATTIFIGLLFILLGNYMAKIKMNWFLGIRNPWTLSSEEVWNKTHRMGGRIFVLSGLIMMFVGYVPTAYRTYLILLIVLLMVFSTMIYSYYLYAKENKTNGNK